MISATIQNNKGDKGHPCLTPAVDLTDLYNPFFQIMSWVTSVNNVRRQAMKPGGNQFLAKCDTSSYAVH